MTIRKADQTELNVIQQYAQTVRSEALYGQADPLEEPNHSLVSKTIHSGGYYMVDKEQAELRGWVGVGKIVDHGTGEFIGFIPEVYVKKAYRRQGIAERLCRRVVAELQMDGVNRVQLQVFAGNPAKILYQRLGFTDTSVVMEKKLERKTIN